MAKPIEALIDKISQDVKHPNLISQTQDACRKKQAFCFGADRARLVLQPMSKDGIPYVFIWLAASTEPDSIARYLHEVKTLTRLIGGRWIEFYTARQGFIRLAARLGWDRLPNEDGLMKFKIPM